MCHAPLSPRTPVVTFPLCVFLPTIGMKVFKMSLFQQQQSFPICLLLAIWA